MESNSNLRKSKAVLLRKSGKSIREIEILLGIPRSTLSGWLKDVVLTDIQREKLNQQWVQALIKARVGAVLYHREGKRKRMEKAQKDAQVVFSLINDQDVNVLKLALAMLYAGEGHKKAGETSLGNSDPKILRTYIALIDRTYGLNKSKLRLYLSLRADQDFKKELEFWSKSLNVGVEYFNKIAQYDKRTIGRKTFDDYHGVCVVRYYDVSIKRELMALTDLFFDRF